MSEALVLTIVVSHARDLFHVRASPAELIERSKQSKKASKAGKKGKDGDSESAVSKKKQSKTNRAKKGAVKKVEEEKEEIVYPLCTGVSFPAFKGNNADDDTTTDTADANTGTGVATGAANGPGADAGAAAMDSKLVQSQIVDDSVNPVYQLTYRQSIPDRAVFRDALCTTPFVIDVNQFAYDENRVNSASGKDGGGRKKKDNSKKKKSGDDEPSLIGKVTIDLNNFLSGDTIIADWFPVSIDTATMQSARELAVTRASENSPTTNALAVEGAITSKQPQLYVTCRLSQTLITPAASQKSNLVTLRIKSVENMPTVWMNEPLDATSSECTQSFDLSYDMHLSGTRTVTCKTQPGTLIAPPPTVSESVSGDDRQGMRGNRGKKGNRRNAKVTSPSAQKRSLSKTRNDSNNNNNSGSNGKGGNNKYNKYNGNGNGNGNGIGHGNGNGSAGLTRPRCVFNYERKHYLTEDAVAKLCTKIKSGLPLMLNFSAARKPVSEKELGNPLLDFSLPGASMLSLRSLLKPGATSVIAKVPFYTTVGTQATADDEEEEKSTNATSGAKRKGSKIKGKSKKNKKLEDLTATRVLETYQQANTYVTVELSLEKPLVASKKTNQLIDLLPLSAIAATLDNETISSSSTIQKAPTLLLSSSLRTVGNDLLASTDGENDYETTQEKSYKDKQPLSHNKHIIAFQSEIQSIAEALSAMPLQSWLPVNGHETLKTGDAVNDVMSHIKGTGLYSVFKEQLKGSIAAVAKDIFHQRLSNDINPDNQQRLDPSTLSNQLYIKLSQQISTATSIKLDSTGASKSSTRSASRLVSASSASPSSSSANGRAYKRSSYTIDTNFLTPHSIDVFGLDPALYATLQPHQWLAIIHTTPLHSSPKLMRSISAYFSQTFGVSQEDMIEILSYQNDDDRLLMMKEMMIIHSSYLKAYEIPLRLTDLCEINDQFQLASVHHQNAVAKALDALAIANQAARAAMDKSEALYNDCRVKVQKLVCTLMDAYTQYACYLLRRGAASPFPSPPSSSSSSSSSSLSPSSSSSSMSSFDLAQELLTRALSLEGQSNNISANFVMAALLLEKDQPFKAETHIQKIVSSHGDHPMVCMLQAVHHELLEEDEESFACNRRAHALMRQHSTYIDTYMTYSSAASDADGFFFHREVDMLVFNIMGEYSRASSLYLIDSGNMHIYLARVVQALNLKTLNKALLKHQLNGPGIDKRIQSYEPHNGDYGYDIYGGAVETACRMMTEGEYTQANEMLEAVMQRICQMGAQSGLLSIDDGRYSASNGVNRGIVHAMAIKGHIQYLMGDDYNARKAYQTYFKFALQDTHGVIDAMVYLRYSTLLLKAGFADSADDICRRLCLDPVHSAINPFPWLGLGTCCFSVGPHRYAESEIALAEAATLDPMNPSVWLLTATLTVLKYCENISSVGSSSPYEAYASQIAHANSKAMEAGQLQIEAKQALMLALKYNVDDLDTLNYFGDLCLSVIMNGGGLDLSGMAEVVYKRILKLVENNTEKRALVAEVTQKLTQLFAVGGNQ